MENEILSSINEIKVLVYALFGIAFIWLIAMSFFVYQIFLKTYEKQMHDAFQDKGQKLLDNECYEELIELATELLEERTNHTYALWYLGKAYFALEDFEKAMPLFEKIAKTELDWRENVQPYLDEINEVKD